MIGIRLLSVSVVTEHWVLQVSKVNHPLHYNAGNIEIIDAIEDWNMNFSEGNVVKYVARHRYKLKPLEDLKKAKWYLERMIENLEKSE
jgi:hypothetical protein